MKKISPVILSGGSGTRLWPLSRKSRPKQFLAIASDNTMFQDTVLRLDSPIVSENPMVICSDDHRFMVAEQLRELNMTPSAIVLEPIGRNTAPALTIAALMSNPDALLLVLPSDHIIKDKAAFHQALAIAQPLAGSGQIVTFGIVPTHAETGYGYIEASKVGESAHYPISRFVEKPDADTAQQYVDAGNYFWNSGMFMFKASTLLAEMKRFRGDIVSACELALETSVNDMDFTRLDTSSFKQCPSESIDYAVMEKTEHAVVVPLDAGWSDLGSWTSLWESGNKDDNNNIIKGDVLQKASTNCYIHAEHRLVTTLGLDNVIVVETADAVMIANPEHVQDVKALVDQLKAEGRSEAESHREIYRPWGKYDSVDIGERYQVKRITVNPGAKLSVQMHHHRAEHWIVVSGTAKVTIDNVEQLLSENQSTYVPIGSVHSLENPGKVPVEMIEVQSGAYLGEDDIVRFEDLYGRTEQ
ncbi:MAG: mannose-1-phosphate guanylyltransferase/mannose-6-phosphate isomerase [Piscirickettsiaceae bacterium]|nr:MAG: mannose-1-phosphate guanylyltransferase/mannose-6-phosphate isomerase [Piscirickettsiaceae bacterium]